MPVMILMMMMLMLMVVVVNVDQHLEKGRIGNSIDHKNKNDESSHTGGAQQQLQEIEGCSSELKLIITLAAA